MTTILLITIGALLVIIAVLAFLLVATVKAITSAASSKSLSAQELKEPFGALNKIHSIDPAAYDEITTAAARHYLDSRPAECQQYLADHHYFAINSDLTDNK